jgi:hypothetical protein
MSQEINRRSFVGFAGIMATPAWAGDRILEYFQRPEAGERILTIVRTAFDLNDSKHMPALALFAEKLMLKPTIHTDFAEALRLAQDPEAIVERYVIEEFTIRTNYLAYIAGESQQIEVLS